MLMVIPLTKSLTPQTARKDQCPAGCVKFERLLCCIAQVVVAHGLVTGVARRLWAVRHRPPLPHLRCAILCRGGTLRSQAIQQSKRSNLTATRLMEDLFRGSIYFFRIL